MKPWLHLFPSSVQRRKECRKLVTTVGDACVLQSKVEPTWGRKKQLESWKSQYQYLDCHKRKKDASDDPERTRKCKDWELTVHRGKWDEMSEENAVSGFWIEDFFSELHIDRLEWQLVKFVVEIKDHKIKSLNRPSLIFSRKDNSNKPRNMVFKITVILFCSLGF